MSEIDKYYKNWVDETLSKVKLDEDKKEKLLSSHTKEKEKVTSEFRKLTGLDKKDMGFLFAAIALQCIRQYILGGTIGKVIDKTTRVTHNAPSIIKLEKTLNNKYDKVSKTLENIGKYKTGEEIAKKCKVPYDAITNSSKYNLGLEGLTHRYQTLGHDPLFGIIFGTMNILTDTMTLNDFSSFCVDMEDFSIGEEISTLDVAKNALSSIASDTTRLPKALFSQIVHMKTDEFTKIGLPIPGTTILSGKFKELYLKNYDKICFERDLRTVELQTGFNLMINKIIELVHGLYYDEKLCGDRNLYDAKTIKIILYSNIIASSSNILASYFVNPLGVNYLDIGGIGITFYRIIKDIPFMLSLEKEFIDKKLYLNYRREIENLDMEITNLVNEIIK